MGVFSGWVEGILLTVTFISVFTIGILAMNLDYSKTYTTPLTDNDTMREMIEYQESTQTQIQKGNVITDSVIGINIAQSYNLLKGAADIIWTFLSGGFLNNLGNMLNLGEPGMALVSVFRVIWMLGLVFGFLYIFFKVIV